MSEIITDRVFSLSLFFPFILSNPFSKGLNLISFFRSRDTSAIVSLVCWIPHESLNDPSPFLPHYSSRTSVCSLISHRGEDTSHAFVALYVSISPDSLVQRAVILFLLSHRQSLYHAQPVSRFLPLYFADSRFFLLSFSHSIFLSLFLSHSLSCTHSLS